MNAQGLEVLDGKNLVDSIGPHLTEDQAKAIFALGAEAVVFALLAQAKLIGELQRPKANQVDPSTPSAHIPPYHKPSKSRRSKPKGAQPGHSGHRRQTPVAIDQIQDHTLATCPDCDSPVRERGNPRERVIEDIPSGIKPVVTRHVIHGYWCRKCRKTVEPVVTDALPKSCIGLHTGVLSSWLHYQLGSTLSQILDVFNYHLQLKLTAGGLVHTWNRIGGILGPWYDEIREQALQSAVLNADETGWRVDGKTHWLWCFTSKELTYYSIDESRGSAILRRMFQREFQGVLLCDFYNSYNAVVCKAKQRCLPHLMRDVKRTEKLKRPSEDWPEFRKRLMRLVRDSLRLGRIRQELPPEQLESRRARLHARLTKLIALEWRHKECKRLVKRLRRHQNEMFTFLEYEGVPADNNHAERQIRPAVIMRKNSYANGSETGAATQSLLMSVFQTLKQRGLNPIEEIGKAIRTYLKTGSIPQLPTISTASG